MFIKQNGDNEMTLDWYSYHISRALRSIDLQIKWIGRDANRAITNLKFAHSTIKQVKASLILYDVPFYQLKDELKYTKELIKDAALYCKSIKKYTNYMIADSITCAELIDGAFVKLEEIKTFLIYNEVSKKFNNEELNKIAEFLESSMAYLNDIPEYIKHLEWIYDNINVSVRHNEINIKWMTKVVNCLYTAHISDTKRTGKIPLNINHLIMATEKPGQDWHKTLSYLIQLEHCCNDIKEHGATTSPEHFSAEISNYNVMMPYSKRGNLKIKPDDFLKKTDSYLDEIYEGINETKTDKQKTLDYINTMYTVDIKKRLKISQAYKNKYGVLPIIIGSKKWKNRIEAKNDWIEANENETDIIDNDLEMIDNEINVIEKEIVVVNNNVTTGKKSITENWEEINEYKKDLETYWNNVEANKTVIEIIDYKAKKKAKAFKVNKIKTETDENETEAMLDEKQIKKKEKGLRRKERTRLKKQMEASQIKTEAIDNETQANEKQIDVIENQVLIDEKQTSANENQTLSDWTEVDAYLKQIDAFINDMESDENQT